MIAFSFLLLITFRLILDKGRVYAIWDISNEPRFQQGGGGWPYCLDSDACCAKLFRRWASGARQLIHNGAEPVYSARALIDRHNDKLASFDCLSGLSHLEQSRSQEPRSQGRFWMLCPISMQAEYYHEMEQGEQPGFRREETKVKCVSMEKEREANPPEGIRAGLSACQIILSKAAGRTLLKAGLASSAPVHAEPHINTSDSREKLVKSSAAATKGFSISVTPMRFGSIGPGQTEKETDEVSFTYSDTVPGRPYRVCGHVPPGHGNWNLWVTLPHS